LISLDLNIYSLNFLKKCKCLIFKKVSKTLEELVLEWKKDNPVTTADLGMSQFELDKISNSKCPSTESFGQIGEPTLF